MFRRWCALALAALACGHVAAQANRSIAQFHHTAWTIKDGAPQQINELARADDGRLWIASTQGLLTQRHHGRFGQRHRWPAGRRCRAARACRRGTRTLRPNWRSPTNRAPASARPRPRPRRIGLAHLKTFDTLDFDVYSNQKWDRLKESHASNILVHYPDGHTTRGITDHIAELKVAFTFAPDSRVKLHPVKIQSGEWTSVIGVMEGTFTQPMHLPDGKVIPPTGKAYKLMVSTVGHWKNGVMDEEFQFWDNAAFMKQIGLGQ
jgi:hypothetical protein